MIFIELREYQQNLVDNIRSSIARGNKSVCAVLGCGGGKSVIEAEIARLANARGNRVLFLVHRRELCDQIARTFAACGVDLTRTDIMMVQTATRRIEKLDKPDLIITDECFPAGTMIGARPIETIKPGDFVESYNHVTGKVEKRKVLHVFVNPMPENLVLIDGSLYCTQNHPIYNPEKGKYINANNVKRYDPVLCRMQCTDQMGRYNKEPERNLLPKREAKNLLLFRMLESILPSRFLRNDEQNKPKIRIRSNESQQPNGERREPQKDVRHTETHWTQTANYHGERSRNDGTAGSIIQRTRGIFAHRGVCDFNQGIRWRLSGLLQSRYSLAQLFACHRGGWRKSLHARAEGRGQEERGAVEEKRLDSVAILEQRDFAGHEFLRGKSLVYNLEVEGNNNYFANGYLVHNCHHATSASYTRIYDYFPDVPRVGFTATPIRLGEGGLGRVFDDLIPSVTTKWLIEHGYLAPYKYYSYRLADTSRLHTRAGEYIAAEVHGLMEKTAIYGDTVDTYRRIGGGRQTIVYCASITASKATAEAFRSAGYPAEHLDGETPKAERDDAVERFRRGSLRILCNVDLFGEGFDVPDCGCVILLRPTKSLSLFIQQSMRSMRYRPGKTALIIDHVGNVFEHGLPDDTREWSLAERKPKAKNTVHIRECPVCFGVIPAASATCPMCGYEFRPEERKTLEVVDGELVEIDAAEIERRRLRKLPYEAYRQMKSYDELDAFAAARGYKRPAWTIRKAYELGCLPEKFRFLARRYCS